MALNSVDLKFIDVIRNGLRCIQLTPRRPRPRTSAARAAARWAKRATARAEDECDGEGVHLFAVPAASVNALHADFDAGLRALLSASPRSVVMLLTPTSMVGAFGADDYESQVPLNRAIP